MFKKILSLTIALTMLVSMFCGCSTIENTKMTHNEIKSGVTESNNDYADTVVYGTIWTAEDNDTVEAFAVKGDKFIYVGDKDDASSYVKEGVTNVIDNTDKGFIIPACTEGHGHFVGIDALVRMLPGYFVGYDDLMKLLAESMKEEPKPEFFLSWGWDYMKFMNNIDPKRNYAEEIEAIAPGIPVFMFDTSGHNAMCNITALKNAGVYNGEKVRGGAVMTTEEGIPNGLIGDEVVFYVVERVIDFSKIDPETYFAACKNAVNILHKRGFTNYFDAYINALSEKPFYQYINELDKKDELNINMSSCFTVRSYNDKEYKEKINYVAEMADKYHSKHFDPYNIKLFADGVVESRTGWMIDEYPNPEKGKEHGNIVWQPDELNEIVKYANSKNILVHTHSYGDGATKAMLDVYINANNSLGKKYRNTLGHVRNITKEDIRRASENGIGIAENLIWHAMDIPDDENYEATIETAKSNYPKGIFESGYPMKSLLDAGITVSSSTDAPAAETLEGNILNILSVATTGLSPDKDNTVPYNTSELLTVREALKCLTINGAKNMGIDDKTGSIKVGKNADFVILDTNFLDYTGADLRKIHNAKIKDVYFEGKNVYNNK